MILCKYQLKGSMRVFTQLSKTKSVCGVILCYTCQTNFSCQELDRCPFHHKEIKRRNDKQKKTWIKNKCLYRSTSLQLVKKSILSKTTEHRLKVNKSSTKKRHLMKYCEHCSLFNQLRYIGDHNYRSFSKVSADNHRHLIYVFNYVYDFETLEWLENNKLSDLHVLSFFW